MDANKLVYIGEGGDVSGADLMEDIPLDTPILIRRATEGDLPLDILDEADPDLFVVVEFLER